MREERPKSSTSRRETGSDRFDFPDALLLAPSGGSDGERCWRVRLRVLGTVTSSQRRGECETRLFKSASRGNGRCIVSSRVLLVGSVLWGRRAGLEQRGRCSGMRSSMTETAY